MRYPITAAAVLVIATPALSAQVPAAQSPTAIPGWKWTMDSVNKTVNAVRAGRNLQPKAWPGGKKVAVLLSFDADNETVTLRFGETSVGALSMGQYGARVGLERIVKLLDARQIPASFFIPSVSLELHPEMATLINKSGRNEFGIHGWIHEMNVTLPEAVERDLLVRAIADVTRITGKKPTGYRAPSWNFSPNTLAIIRDLGFRYESSLMADDRAYELVQDGKPTGMVELPVEWILDDAPLFNPNGDRYSPPREVARVWMDEFDKAYEEGTMFVLTMHPHITGHRSRIVALELLLDHIRAKAGANVWYATHGEVAEYVRKEAKLGEPIPRSTSQPQEPAGGWPQHSRERPAPAPQAPPAQSLPTPRPAGATSLFDGTSLSGWQTWDGKPAGWKLIDGGAMEVAKGTGDIQTKASFGDVEVHVEWASPNPPEGKDQDRGNSGVFLMGTYEVQVLDSYGNATYADGSAASIYGQVPPRVNVSRPPGEWQSFDVKFTRPRFDGAGILLTPARLTVRHNGVLVQDDVALYGPTSNMRRAPYQVHADRLPIKLQDHGHLVRFRNIWVRDLEKKQ